MIYHYFLSANSAQGYVDWTARRAAQLTQVSRTVGYPKAFYRALVGAAMENAKERSLRLDIIHRPLDGAVSGLIVPSRGTAVFNTPLWNDKSRHIACLCTNDTRDDMQQQLGEVYSDYAAAKAIHDAWEQIYIKETDFAKLDTLAQDICVKLLGEAHTGTEGARTDAFFGAATPDGSVDYIACLTAEIKQRYFLKGRPGTGKSTFLKTVADAAQAAGHDIEVYHCSFDTNSLDMIIIRSLSVCIFDSTSPHEYFPTRAGDEILDLYASAVRPGTDERYAAQLALMAKQYKLLTGRATRRMVEIREYADIWEHDMEAQLDTSRTAVALETITNSLFE